MKKLFCIRNILIFICISIIFSFAYFKFFSFHTQILNVDKFKLSVPFYSKYYNSTKSNDGYVLMFKTLLTKSILLNKTNEILGKYEEYICQNQLFYYDKDNNATIKKIDISNKLFINQYSITLSNGKFDNNYCSKVVNYKDLKYQIKPIFSKPYEIEYKNTIDGNMYKIYFNLENKDILLSTGMNKMNYLGSMLKYGWVSMNQFLDYLDYTTSIKDGSKIESEKNIIYKTNDFSLLKCNNNNIYIYEKEYEFLNSICR